MLGKSVNDLQSNITVGTSAITGTLKHVSGYTGFSGDVSEQSGNYIALHVESNDADSVSVELLGDAGGEITLDSDGMAILRISNTSQWIRVKAYLNGAVANVRTYSLSGLILEGE